MFSPCIKKSIASKYLASEVKIIRQRATALVGDDAMMGLVVKGASPTSLCDTDNCPPRSHLLQRAGTRELTYISLKIMAGPVKTLLLAVNDVKTRGLPSGKAEVMVKRIMSKQT